jgi:hypothetical protein
VGSTPREQLQAERFLQFADLHRQPGLRGMDALGRRSERALLVDDDEALDLLQLHATPIRKLDDADQDKRDSSVDPRRLTSIGNCRSALRRGGRDHV